MKTIFVKRNVWTLFTGMLLSIFMLSCTKDDNGNAETYTTTGNASGSQQNPAVTTTGTSSLTGSYNATTNNWQYTITWSTLTSAATAVQLYGPADIGLNG